MLIHPVVRNSFPALPKGCDDITQGTQPMDSSLWWPWRRIRLICFISRYSCLLQVCSLKFSEHFHPFSLSALQVHPHYLLASSGKDPALTSVPSCSCEPVSSVSLQVSSLWLSFSQWHTRTRANLPCVQARFQESWNQLWSWHPGNQRFIMPEEAICPSPGTCKSTLFSARMLKVKIK